MKFWVVLLFLFLFPTQIFAGIPFRSTNNNPMFFVITGTVEKMTLNALEIRDENDKQLKRFVYFDTDVQVGDRVRAQYDPSSLRITLLKKMTKLEYKKDGQNLGYIVQEEKKP